MTYIHSTLISWKDSWTGCWTFSASAFARVRGPSSRASKCVDADHLSVENDTLARIGTSCLQQLLESNVKKLSVARWERVATTFVKLFRTTTPHQLFDENLRVEIDSGTPEPQETNGRSPFGCIRATFSLRLRQMATVRRLFLHPYRQRKTRAKRRLPRRH